MSLSSGRTDDGHRRFMDDDLYDESDDKCGGSIGSDDEGDNNRDNSDDGDEKSPRASLKRTREVAELTTETDTTALIEKARFYADRPIELPIYRKEHKHVNRVKEHAVNVSIQHCQLLVTHERNLLVGARDDAESFENCLDHYSSLHSDVVYGMRLLDLANAFFPTRTITPSLTDVNTEPTVTGVPISFFAMVREVAKHLVLNIDRIYPLLSTAYLPTQISLAKNKEWQSESDLFKGAFDPSNRRFPKDRVIPIYLIPHFFATHAALKNHPHNNAIIFGHRLIREMERRVPAKYLDNCYMDCLRQLYANFDKLAYHFTSRTEMLSVLLERVDHLNAMYESLASQHEEVLKRLDGVTARKALQSTPNTKGSTLPPLTPIPRSNRAASQQQQKSVPQPKKPATAIDINALMLSDENDADDQLKEDASTPKVNIFALTLDDNQEGEGEVDDDDGDPMEEEEEKGDESSPVPDKVPLKRQRLENGDSKATLTD